MQQTCRHSIHQTCRHRYNRHLDPYDNILIGKDATFIYEYILIEHVVMYQADRHRYRSVGDDSGCVTQVQTGTCIDQTGTVWRVCQTSKPEQDLRAQLGSNVVRGSSDQDLEKHAYDVANHIQLVFAVLKHTKQRECCQNQHQYMRFPKTKGMRNEQASSE